ncbi:MAG: zf-TFIIB domain-containing protein [Candidatus Gastranaerophilales bacterium]|nr:zf-TFIIB domain-containing protein [Candidatus Gastranaerophilales bacterium]
MTCSKCNGEFNQYIYSDITFGICKNCSSIFLKKSELKKLYRKITSRDNFDKIFNSKAAVVNESAKLCPSCSLNMQKVLFNDVVIDRCDNCEYLLFDDGELSKFFNLFADKSIKQMSNAEFVKTYFNREDITPMPENFNSFSSDINLQGQEEERAAFRLDGWTALIIALLYVAFIVFLFISSTVIPFSAFFAFPLIFIGVFLLKGFVVLKPQEALVLTLFGKYAGTLKGAGFHYINPLTASYNGAAFGGTISLKARTLENGRQKINDKSGNPIEVGIIIIWEVKDTAKALFNVDDYSSFLSAQSDSVLRNIVRMYPYDAPDDSDVQSLRGDSAEISAKLKKEIQMAVRNAGLKIVDAKITHLAYSTEIAAAMLQRQQANAVIDARKAIVDGAVDIVELALNKLQRNTNIILDDKTKANMVNNLLVVLCANKEAQPVIKNDIVI